jgi:hypothetical protein
VIKELSSHLGDGIGAIAANWSPYVLVVAGAGTMLLASHALAAGPLAASQPGFTILDPFSAALLGVFLFSEHIQTSIADLAGEAAALAIVMAGVSALSHSHLIAGEDAPPPGSAPPGHRDQAIAGGKAHVAELTHPPRLAPPFTRRTKRDLSGNGSVVGHDPGPQ